MKFLFRHRLLEWVLRLRIPPFTWLYSIIYNLACVFVLRSLRRRPGLIALYLSGSLAFGRKRPGLSDIDFKILIAGRRDAREIQVIRGKFLQLRRWFPMLGPPDEKGIYFLDDLEEEYRAYPLVQLLFDPRFYRHHLLWGQDWLQQHPFPLLGKPELAQALPWRLKEWNERILLLLDAPSFARPQRRYLLWKALADLGNFQKLLHNPDLVETGSREEALSYLATLLPDAVRPLIKALQTEHDHSFLVDRMRDEQRFDLWREVVRFFALPPHPSGEDATIAVVAHATDWHASKDPHLQALRQAAPPDARCTLSDFFFIPSNPLDADGYGAYARILHLDRPLEAKEYWTLKNAFREGDLGREPVFVVDRGRVGHCLWSIMLDQYLVTETSSDGLLPFVLAAAKNGASYSVCASFLEALRQRLDPLLAQLRPLLNSPALPRLGHERLLRFFFSNLRSIYLAAEASHEEMPRRALHLPGGPESLIDLLSERGLDSRVASFLRSQAGALRHATGIVAWPHLRHVLAQALEVAAHQRSWMEITPPPEERLCLSLILITRNRACMLERCLKSVLAQSRPPDEIIVVDNGSTDDTAGVVRRFESVCPLRYVAELRPGVGRARATGCAAATGDILAFMDDDAVAEPGWLAALEEAFYLDPNVGVVGGRITALSESRSDWVSRAFNQFGATQSC